MHVQTIIINKDIQNSKRQYIACTIIFRNWGHPSYTYILIPPLSWKPCFSGLEIDSIGTYVPYNNGTTMYITYSYLHAGQILCIFKLGKYQHASVLWWDDVIVTPTIRYNGFLASFLGDAALLPWLAATSVGETRNSSSGKWGHYHSLMPSLLPSRVSMCIVCSFINKRGNSLFINGSFCYDVHAHTGWCVRGECVYWRRIGGGVPVSLAPFCVRQRQQATGARWSGRWRVSTGKLRLCELRLLRALHVRAKHALILL